MPILVKICPTLIEILTFNKWSQKLTVSRSVISYLQSMELTAVSIDAIVALAKQKQTRNRKHRRAVAKPAACAPNAVNTRAQGSE